MTMNIEVVVVNGGRARLCRAETRFPGRKSRLEGSRPAVMGNRQSEGCHAKAMQRGGRNPHLASNRVKPSQSQSKRFPIVALGRRFQPPPRYIVVPQAKCTTRCGLPLQHTPTQPCNPQFESNPVKVSQSVFQTPLSGLGFCTPLLPPDPQLGKHHPSCPIQSYPTDSGNPPCPPKLQRRRKSAIRVKPSRTQSHL